ncbi:MAG: 50S ribosomal protein L21e [Candidatus Thermoplasmatota archaeon]|nr:50S ribosomal protein L21e [Candidatus Thermoplasmatota archaeon]MCL5793354.1 50S ribosomal protein L21e [Candidatus Thermoplasmatota archaeon]
MAKMSHGPRSGSRMKMTKGIKEKGMPRVNDLMKSFEIGEKAAIVINPSIHSGMPFHNFHGLTGTVVNRQGECYVISLKVGSVEKHIVAGPAHLKKLASS